MMNLMKYTKAELIETIEKQAAELQRLQTIEGDFKICQDAVVEQTKAFEKAQKITSEFEGKTKTQNAQELKLKEKHKKEIDELEEQYIDLQRQYTVEMKKVQETYALREAQILAGKTKETDYYKAQMTEQNGVLLDLFDLVEDGIRSKAFIYNKFKKVFIKEVPIKNEETIKEE